MYKNYLSEKLDLSQKMWLKYVNCDFCMMYLPIEIEFLDTRLLRLLFRRIWRYIKIISYSLNFYGKYSLEILIMKINVGYGRGSYMMNINGALSLSFKIWPVVSVPDVPASTNVNRRNFRMRFARRRSSYRTDVSSVAKRRDKLRACSRAIRQIINNILLP